MKKLIAAGAAALVLIVGAAGGVRYATSDDAPCAKPLTIFSSEQTASIEVLEEYISTVIAPSFKFPEQLQWASDDFAPIILPNKISARIMIIEGQNTSAPRYFHVTLVRDCQGGDWKVVEFKKVSA